MAKPYFDDTQRFTVTVDHIKLLRAAHTRWYDCEFGAPGIDCKRPYGDSFVYDSIAEVLDIKLLEDDPEEDDPQYAYMDRVHRETETALQIFLATGEMGPGGYVASKYGADWRAEEASS